MIRDVYRHPHFFDSDTCRCLRLAMDGGQADDAEILGSAIEHRDDTRRAASVEIGASLIAQVEERLELARARLGDFFAAPLQEREGAGFVRYHAGGFYAPHRDRADVPSWPDAARRLVAVVVFLNTAREVDARGSFDGGALRLFFAGGSVDVHPAEGELVAFPAELLHEVTIVRGGIRDVVVDWFYGDRY